MGEISKRAAAQVAEADIPFRFPNPGARGLYDVETNPQGVIRLSSAENTLIGPELDEFSRNKLRIPGVAFSYQYETAPEISLPRALATHLNEWFHPFKPLSSQEVLIASGATAHHEILGYGLAEAGEGILISRPYYGRFELDFVDRAGLKLVTIDTEPEQAFEPAVVSWYEEALLKSDKNGVKIRAILIVNPHNPLGRCYPRETLVGLMALCGKYGINLISDEIYGLSVFDSGEPGVFPFTSVLSLDTTGLMDPSSLHVIYGFSKDYGAAGLRIGAIITRNTELSKYNDRAIRFSSPSGASYAVATAMLEDRTWCRMLIESSRKKIASAYVLATKELRELDIAYVRGVNAGFFVFTDLSRFLPPKEMYHTDQERGIALAEKILEAGVLVSPGEEHAVRPGWVRMVYTAEEATMQEAFKRLRHALQTLPWAK